VTCIISYVIQNFSFQKVVLTPRIINFIIIKNFNFFFFFFQQRFFTSRPRLSHIFKHLFFLNSYDYFFTLKDSFIFNRSYNFLTYYTLLNNDSLRYWILKLFNHSISHLIVNPPRLNFSKIKLYNFNFFPIQTVNIRFNQRYFTKLFFFFFNWNHYFWLATDHYLKFILNFLFTDCYYKTNTSFNGFFFNIFHH